MDMEDKLNVVKEKLKSDLAAADLRLSLLSAALSSYRHDTVLRPFPPMCKTRNTSTQEDVMDYRGLEKNIENIPALAKLVTTQLRDVESKVIELMHWCLTDKQFVLKRVNKDKFSDICQKTETLVAVAPPDFVFDVSYCKETEDRFQQLRQDRKLFYAFHGSNLENFHCILHFGLQGHMSKNALFGEGTYLSSEPSICLNYAPHGRGWEKSALGERLSCVALCEVIDHPSVKCQVKGEDGKTSRSKIRGSEGGDIPEKYYVVRNNDVLRVCNLLIYVDKSVKKRVTSPWIVRHKLAVFIALYAFILVAVGLYKSKSFQAFIKKKMQR